MKKEDEQNQRDSCLNKAYADEYIFVILARDPAAQAAIRAWTIERIKLGLNDPVQAQLVEAFDLSVQMQIQRPEIRARLEADKERLFKVPEKNVAEQLHEALSARVEDIGVDAFYGKEPK